MASLEEKPRQKMQLAGFHQLTDDVFQVFLKTCNHQPLDFMAGQYLMLHLPDSSESHAFSIASSPLPKTDTLELHIQCERDNSIVQKIVDHHIVEASLPYGKSFLGKDQIPDTPLIFIAAATGFAQMKSMIEFLKECPHNCPLILYWGVRRPQSFYLPYLPVQWARNGLVEYHPVVSNIQQGDVWKGRFGLLYEAVLEDCHRFANGKFYISGSPNMVYATVDALQESGFSTDVMHSDVFEYAPR